MTHSQTHMHVKSNTALQHNKAQPFLILEMEACVLLCSRVGHEMEACVLLCQSSWSQLCEIDLTFSAEQRLSYDS